MYNCARLMTANSERSNASRHVHQALYRATYNIPSLQMATLDPEPFGKPDLLLGSSLLLDTNDTATFTSNGLLGPEPFGGNGGGGENATSAQNPPWGDRLDEIGSASDDELSTFTTNGLLDGPTQVTGTVISPL